MPFVLAASSFTQLGEKFRYQRNGPKALAIGCGGNFGMGEAWFFLLQFRSCLSYRGRVKMKTGRGRKSIAEMMADFLREVAALIVIFVPLELMTMQKLTPDAAVKSLIGATLLFIGGVALERLR